MANIPVKPIFKLAKQYGPTAGKYVLKNWKSIISAVPAAVKVKQSADGLISERKEFKQNQGKIHYRKTRFIDYKTKILKDLGKKNRKVLFDHILEVRQFIKQIENEEKKKLSVKKPLNSKRINNWKSILIQIEDKIETKDYQEYLMIFNNPNYQSIYFEGFEGQIIKFKEVVNKGDSKALNEFIFITTKKSIEEIKKDFI